MKYLITERQYNLLTEDKILRLPFDAFNNDWNLLQRFLEKRGNPPYKITGDLDLRNSNIKSLGNLESVGGNLDLEGSNIQSLGNLQSVGGYLNLYDSKIESLGNLQSVGGYLDLIGSKIESLGNLQSVDGNLNLYGSEIQDLGNLVSVGGDLDLKFTPLAKTTTEKKIRNKVEVGGNIYL